MYCLQTTFDLLIDLVLWEIIVKLGQKENLGEVLSLINMRK